ncbi:HNH endonuclease signature motif containing protein [Streptomyces sp. ME02-6979-3A]|uniref:HNH endonuclease signature motif containing protein n=1 Tax=Streptomyces sp. ME02-6979-3A TaxID=3028673 RepID=UPI0029A8CF97|nr:HNH endonuclease signature motif containing protein [Streptomyces sp. ME02-6979-3A]MDX3328828.1 HNH endonuclease signature motif containing protein [Streptomyces sp. ME02-6979-3A]
MSRRKSAPAAGKVRVGTDSIGRPIWRRPDDPKAKLLARTVADPNGCLIWTGPKNNHGYGRIFVNGEQHYTHRLSYQLDVGSIPDGLYLDHLCRVPACCNPQHLEPVTPRENSRRGEPANRTHCPAGHLYDEANTIVRERSDWKTKTPVRSRECRTCSSLQKRAKWATRTHCDKGHEYTPENTITCSDGKRWCRTCREAFYAARRKTAHSPGTKTS